MVPFVQTPAMLHATLSGDLERSGLAVSFENNAEPGPWTAQSNSNSFAQICLFDIALPIGSFDSSILELVRIGE